MSKGLKKVLKKVFASDVQEQLAVADAKLGSVIKVRLCVAHLPLCVCVCVCVCVLGGGVFYLVLSVAVIVTPVWAETMTTYPILTCRTK